MGKLLTALFVKAVLYQILVGVVWAEEPCNYGSLPGTSSITDTGYQWNIYDRRCALQNLLPYFAAQSSASEDKVVWKSSKLDGASILMIGDSVDRHMLWDLNSTALKANWTGHESLMKEHWRGAVRLANLEMVYHFAPGSHDYGPYHDDLNYDMSIVNAIPRGFEMHRLLTGRSGPNIVVFSNILWDLGRWLFLSEVADSNQTDYYGMPLLGENEVLEPELLDEWRRDTHIQMQRIERYAGKDAILIYHNAAFPKLLDFYKNGSKHEQTGTGRRTHIVQLNALARQVTNGVKVRIHIQAYILEDLYLADKLGPGNQILTQTSMGPLTGRVKVVKERPRWHLVDFGHMSEAFITGAHLRDPHHPREDFMMKALDIYLNLHAEFGSAPLPRQHVIGDVQRWDIEYELHGKQHREVYSQENQRERSRWIQEEAARRKADSRSFKDRKTSIKEVALRHGMNMMVNLRGRHH